MDDCWIGIGGNLRDPQLAFRSVWNQLRGQSEVVLNSRSGLYQTQPVGQHAGDSFTNAVFSLSTSLSPIELLDCLQSIELELGRQRAVRWGARPIDLDILFVDQMVVRETRLTIPHPGAWYRRFVIDPLAEIAPSLRHPQLDLTVEELRNRLSLRPFVVTIPEMTTSDILREFGDIHSRFPQTQLVGCDSEVPVTVAAQLGSQAAAMTTVGTPIADLTNTPGDRSQRLVDFLTAALDEPVRVGDWAVDC